MKDLLLELVAKLGLPVIIAAVVWYTTGDWVRAVVAGILTAVGVFVLRFLGKVWGELEPGIVKGLAANISEDWQRRTSRYYRDYRQHLLDRFHNVDLGGIGFQSEYNLELDRVFVELRVAPERPGSVRTGFVPARDKTGTTSIRTIWDLLASGGRRFAILGYPGSGKTTLLKHTAMTLFNPRQRTAVGAQLLLPIFIEMRKHAKTIREQSDVTLEDIIRASVKDAGSAPPPGWFTKRLQRSKCLIMFDGLDEVPTVEDRQVIVRWIDGLMSNVRYSANTFIITSRPQGYRSNPSGRVEVVLEVLPFNPQQQHDFIHYWYTADQIKREAGKDTTRVRADARQIADRLYGEIRSSETFSDLASSPLLLTMMALVYRQRQKLPEDRARLYADVCEVFLGKRWEARDIKLDMRPDQAQIVLQPLAYHMMRKRILQIGVDHALQVIREPLAHITSIYSADRQFLEIFELRSGLLVEHEDDIYSFAHKTIQEFLAAVHIQRALLEAELIAGIVEHPDDDWWHETARLYCARGDATNMINACLDVIPLHPALVALAIECERLGQKVAPETRQRLNRLLQEVAEDHDDPSWSVVAEALLRLRLQGMISMDSGQATTLQVATSFFTHSDYQLFIDSVTDIDLAPQPVHWNTSDAFRKGNAHKPVLGVDPRQVLAFCQWLSARDSAWQYRMPAESEIANLYHVVSGSHDCWIRVDESRAALSTGGPSALLALVDIVQESLHALSRALDRTGERRYAFFGRLPLLRTRNLKLDRDLTFDLDLARSRDRDLDLAFTLVDSLVYVVDPDGELGLKRDFELGSDVSSDHDLGDSVAHALARVLARCFEFDQRVSDKYVIGLTEPTFGKSEDSRSYAWMIHACSRALLWVTYDLSRRAVVRLESAEAQFDVNKQTTMIESILDVDHKAWEPISKLRQLRRYQDLLSHEIEITRSVLEALPAIERRKRGKNHRLRVLSWCVSGRKRQAKKISP